VCFSSRRFSLYARNGNMISPLITPSSPFVYGRHFTRKRAESRLWGEFGRKKGNKSKLFETNRKKRFILFILYDIIISYYNVRAYASAGVKTLSIR
jgi:hypothetical protein